MTTEAATEWKWTSARTRAAQLVAEDKLSDEQIASQVGITRRALAKWKNIPEFEERRKAIVEELRQAINRKGIFDKVKRMESINRDFDATETILEERGADDDMQDVPGGKTGFIVHNIKVVGGGPHAEKVDTYEYDSALERQREALRKEARQETGEDVQKHELTGKDGGPIKGEMSFFELARIAALDEDEGE